MNTRGYWIVLSAGWDHSRPHGKRWEAVAICVLPADLKATPDIETLAGERPGRLVLWGMWAPLTGWNLCGTEGSARLKERFAVADYHDQMPVRAAINTGVRLAMRLAMGLGDTDRDPFPTPGAN